MTRKKIIFINLCIFFTCMICGLCLNSVAFAAENNQTIKISVNGKGYVACKEPQTFQNGDKFEIYLDIQTIFGEAEQLGFAMTDTFTSYESGVGALISIGADKTTTSSGKIEYGSEITLSKLLNERYECIGVFDANEGTFSLLFRGRLQIDYDTAIFVTGLTLPNTSAYVGLQMKGKFDLYLNQFSLKKTLAPNLVGSHTEDLEYNEYISISGDANDFTLDTKIENHLSNRYPADFINGTATISMKIKAITSDTLGFGVANFGDTQFTTNGVYVNYTEEGTKVFVDGVAFSATLSKDLKFSDVFVANKILTATFNAKQNTFILTSNDAVIQTISNFQSFKTNNVKVGMQLSAGSSLSLQNYNLSMKNSFDGEAVVLGGNIKLQKDELTKGQDIENAPLYSFNGSIFMPDGKGGFFTEEEKYTAGSDIKLMSRNATLESNGAFTCDSQGFVAVESPVDVSAEGMTLVMEYTIKSISTDNVAMGDWLGIVVGDALNAGNNMYSSGKALMAFPKGQSWQAGISMEEALVAGTSYQAIYKPTEKTITYYYKNSDNVYLPLGNGVYLPDFNAGNINKQNIFIGFQAYNAPCDIVFSEFKVYTAKYEKIRTEYPSISEITKVDGYIANSKPLNLNSSAVFMEFDITKASATEKAYVGFSWNDRLDSKTFLNEHKLSDRPIIKFYGDGEGGAPIYEKPSAFSDIFKTGKRLRVKFDPKNSIFTIESKDINADNSTYVTLVSYNRLRGVLLDNVFFGLQLTADVELGVANVKIYEQTYKSATKYVYTSKDAANNTIYIAAKQGIVSHETALKGESLVAEMTILDYTAPADRILIGEDKDSILAPWISIIVNDGKIIDGTRKGFCVKYYNTTTKNVAAQTQVEATNAEIKKNVTISNDRTQFDVFKKDIVLRLAYFPAQGIFQVSQKSDNNFKVIQSVYGLKFTSENYFLALEMQDGIKLTSNDLKFYSGGDYFSTNINDSVISGDVYAGNGTANSIVKSVDSGLTVVGDGFDTVTKYKTYNGANGYKFPKIYTDTVDISEEESSFTMDFEVESYEDLNNTINFISFGIAKTFDSDINVMASDVANNTFICYRPAYGVTDSYYHSHFRSIVAGTFSQRNVNISNFMKSGAKVRISYVNKGDGKQFPYYKLQFKTADMKDFKTLQFVYSLIGLSVKDARFIFEASSSLENANGDYTKTDFSLKNLKFYTTKASAPVEYEIADDLSISDSLKQFPVAVQVKPSDEAQGVVSGSAVILYGDKITIQAEAKEGYIFEGWYEITPESILDGMFKTKYKISKDADFTFTLGDTIVNAKEVNIVARFVPYVLAKIETTKVQVEKLGVGLCYTIGANCLPGYELDYWELNGVRYNNANADGSITLVIDSQDINLKAIYKAVDLKTDISKEIPNVNKLASDTITYVTIGLAILIVISISTLFIIKLKKSKGEK